eukprot:m.333158 g.333158  ORF g.333158 m.333158 type:complete len:344 (-) comp17084_c0_seq1:961-1992(-)
MGGELLLIVLLAPALGSETIGSERFKSNTCKEWLEQQPGHDIDLVVIPALKAVFVDNVKVGSTTIRQAFTTVFRVDWWWRHIKHRPSQMEALNSSAELTLIPSNPDRSSSSQLTDEVLENYFFFGFIRSPVSRFVSSLTQAGSQYLNHNVEDIMSIEAKKRNNMHKIKYIPNTTIHEILHKLMDENVYVNEHFQSQLWRLSPSLADGRRIPIHFVGHLDQWKEHWEKLRTIFLKRTPTQKVRISRLLKMVNVHRNHHSGFGPLAEHEVASSLDIRKRIEELYSMDYDCFGFEREFPAVRDHRKARATCTDKQIWHRYNWDHLFVCMNQTESECCDKTRTFKEQ